MKTICKQCGNRSTNGTKFCTKKCRKIWIENHKLTKKDFIKRENFYFRNIGVAFDSDGNSI